MIWPESFQRKVFEYLTKATGGVWPRMAQEAQELLDEERAIALGPKDQRRMPWQKKPRTGVDKSALPFPAKAPGPTKDDRGDERRSIIRAIWERITARAGKRCEWCRFGEHAELHHLFAGSERRLLESEFNCCGICAGDAKSCHERQQESPAWGRQQELAWAKRLLADAHRRRDANAIAGFTDTIERLEGSIALLEAKHLTTGGTT